MTAQGAAPRPTLEPRPHRRQAKSGRHNPTVLDSIFILLASVTLLLILFWIVAQVAGQNTFNSLPPWLGSAIQSVSAKVSLSSGTVLSFALRRWLDKEPAPNYLLWIPGFIVFLLIAVVAVSGVTKMITPPHGIVRSETTLKLKAPIPDIQTIWSDQGKLQVRVIENSPNVAIDGGDKLSASGGPSEYEVKYVSNYPVPSDQSFIADIGWVRAQSRPGLATPKDYDLCLKPTFRNVSSLELALECSSGHCTPTKKDLFVACREYSSLPVVFADSEPTDNKRAWVVPSLETLEKMTDRERVGYTRFEIQYQPSAAAKAGDLFYYAISVNEQPLYVDNFPPAVLRTKLSPLTNQIKFGLENLNFSGEDRGKEMISLTLVILKAGKEIMRQSVERDYVALRDPTPVPTVQNAAGTFTWTGSYVKPKNENRYEVFVSSTLKPHLAMAAKTRYAALSLSYSGSGTVMVVRPPFAKNPSYGLVLGLIQPTSQVQFTFTKDEALAVCKWGNAQVGLRGSRGLIRSDLYIYDNDANHLVRCQ